jgi:anti-sigma factor RsiW
MVNHLTYDVLSRLVEHRASALEEARAQRHLARCARCRSECEWLERVRRASYPHNAPQASERYPGVVNDTLGRAGQTR